MMLFLVVFSIWLADTAPPEPDLYFPVCPYPVTLSYSFLLSLLLLIPRDNRSVSILFMWGTSSAISEQSVTDILPSISTCNSTFCLYNRLKTIPRLSHVCLLWLFSLSIRWMQKLYWKNAAFKDTTNFDHIKTHYYWSQKMVSELSLWLLLPSALIFHCALRFIETSY